MILEILAVLLVVWFARIFARLVQHRRDVLYYVAKSDPYRICFRRRAQRHQMRRDRRSLMMPTSR